MPPEQVDQHPRPATVQQVQPAKPRAAHTVVKAEAPVCTPSQVTATGPNGDEQDFPTYLGNYHKGLEHDQYGVVVKEVYDNYFLAAVGTTTPAPDAFTNIPLALKRKLTNPQAGLATDLEGPDPKTLAIRSAPKVNSPEAAAEAVELYWMSLLRDVPFSQFGDTDTHPLIATALTDLSRLAAFTGPKVGGKVTPETLFRGCAAGSNRGPLVSQFLLLDVPYGSLTISHRQRTVVGGHEYLTDPVTWLAVQDGSPAAPPDLFDPTPRYIRNMRDLGQYVHVDALYEAYLNACLILLGMNAPVDKGNPYYANAPYGQPSCLPSGNQSKTQIGFGTFGGPHILSLVCEVATRALKAVWFQKWFVHRRLRPEAYGGLVHFRKTGARQDFPVHDDVLNSPALDEVFARHGTYLLPMQFPEGSPTHPAYGAGHATVAGACVTILKAFFDEDYPIPHPVVPNDDGTALVPYTGPDAHRLTVGGELDKVAANIAIGRNMAGVHWRSDYRESVLLGQTVALCVLHRQARDYHEDYSFTVTLYDGTRVVVDKSGVKTADGKPYALPGCAH
ncbi:PAP2 superfamily protein [Gemmata obscuriglobus]|uniref:vanadium-dependent haloperoxidase n=1 Tax=Gemmata obscuriglobus TaxID=114 RepID=UPI00016C48B8|nr:vanadium-dependent haloperoxidase [Gemmata obscuriglobus]QEG30618.1 PAP2 superfamily protein [Gemmata obscuriglobus]VTS09942.1 phosphoesterase : Twin-arginine translocation pathway signal OS=Nodularia spumigena CCY9414 GN=N9414_11699 PE=4 SV=1: PAP2 [Gemmata obscuriglobus UQM 2246]